MSKKTMNKKTAAQRAAQRKGATQASQSQANAVAEKSTPAEVESPGNDKGASHVKAGNQSSNQANSDNTNKPDASSGTSAKAGTSKAVTTDKLTSEKASEKASEKGGKSKTPTANTAQSNKADSDTGHADKGQSTSANDQASAQSVAQPVVAAQNNSSGRGISWLALLLSLAALGAGGYAAYQTTLSEQLAKVQGSGVDTQVSGIDAQVKLVTADQTVIKASVGEVESRLKKVDQATSDSLKQLDQKLTENQKLISSVKSDADATMSNLKGDLTERISAWKLDEVRSLLMLVGQRLRWTDNVAEAIRGLSEADRALSEMNDASFDIVRSELATEVNALRVLKPVDITRVHNQLAALSGEITDLPLPQDAIVNQAPISQSKASTTAEANEEGGWLSAGKSLMSSFVKVENIDATPTPALDGQARFMVATSLQLRLQEAQIALLKGQAAAYQSALLAAEKWAANHYAGDSSKVAAWIKEIKSLAGVSTALNVPDVSGSLIALDKAIQARN